MRLLPREQDLLLVFVAAELARRRRANGLKLNHPEAVALICDAMLEAARAGLSFAEVEAIGRAAVREDELLEGVRALLDEIRLEVLLEDGTRLIVLVEPLSATDPLAPPSPETATLTSSSKLDNGGSKVTPGEVRLASEPVELAAGRERRTLRVESTSHRIVRVSSHYPFDRTNRRLLFDRVAAVGFHLDVPAGGSVGWAPGQVREVTLVRFGGQLGAGSSHSREYPQP